MIKKKHKQTNKTERDEFYTHTHTHTTMRLIRLPVHGGVIFFFFSLFVSLMPFFHRLVNKKKKKKRRLNWTRLRWWKCIKICVSPSPFLPGIQMRGILLASCTLEGDVAWIASQISNAMCSCSLRAPIWRADDCCLFRYDSFLFFCWRELKRGREEANQQQRQQNKDPISKRINK